MKYRAIVLFVVVVATAAAPAGAQYNGVPKSGMMTKGEHARRHHARPAEEGGVRTAAGRAGPARPAVHRRGRDGPSSCRSTSGGRPVVLALVYYECPMLCVQALNGLVQALKVMTLEPGRDYDIVTVSFNPRETPAQAAAKKAHYLSHAGQARGAATAWHFLTGEEAPIRMLTDAVGLPLRVRRAHEAVRAPHGHRRADAGGPRLASTSTGSTTARATCGSRSSRPRADKIGTPVDQLAALLLPLRPDAGQVRPGRS